MAAAMRRLRATTSATPAKNSMSQPSPVTRLWATILANSPCRYVEVPDQVGDEALPSTRVSYVAHHLDAGLGSLLLLHAQVEGGQGTILAEEGARYVVMLRLAQDVGQMLPTQKRSEWMPVRFLHKHWERQDGAYSFVVFEGLLQVPQFFVLFFGVEPAASFGCDDQGQRVGAAITVDYGKAFARLPAWLEVVQKTGVSVQVEKAEAQGGTQQDRGYRRPYEFAFPEGGAASLGDGLGFAWAWPNREMRDT